MEIPRFDFAYEEPDVGRQKVRLHFNENLFLPEEYYFEIEPDVKNDDVRYYTDPNNKKLARKIEESLGLPNGTVVVTAGADEGIRLSMQLALHLRNDLVIVEPTYGMARVVARQLGHMPRVLTYREDLSLDVDQLSKLQNSTVYICSPNNPTAHVVKELEDVAARFKGLVILDAAYAEYADYWAPKYLEYGNVVEVRTFSKAWGLAGLRVGYVAAPPKIAEALRVLSPPHPISAVSALMVENALERGRRYVEKSVRETHEVKRLVVDRLPFDKYHGPVNFITLKIRDAETVAERLESEGFVVRVLGPKPLCQSCIRFTLAPMSIMEKFIEALRRAIDLKTA
ncbi:MAG: histidinol-phosphate transaminase [Pyrobaculum sp.]|jgi:histidinol-phosphate aminotransferase